MAAAGYQLPMPVDTPTDADKLAARMEKDTEAAWRAFIEQAQSSEDRTFGVTALTQSAVLAREVEAAARRLADHHGLPRRHVIRLPASSTACRQAASSPG